MAAAAFFIFVQAAEGCPMLKKSEDQLPATFNRSAWSNLAAQSAEQIALAAAPIIAVLNLGVGEAGTGLRLDCSGGKPGERPETDTRRKHKKNEGQ